MLTFEMLASDDAGCIWHLMDAFTALQYMLITGDELLTDKQRAWRDMKRISASFRPLPLQTRPPNKLQARCLSADLSTYASSLLKLPSSSAIQLAALDHQKYASLTPDGLSRCLRRAAATM